MKNTQEARFLGNAKRKMLAWASVFSLLVPLFQPLVTVYATVVDGAIENALVWANGNMVNRTNSGTYSVGFSLSGTLDPGNTIEVVAMDGSGKTATGTYLSSSGGESSGSVLLDFSSAGWLEGALALNALVYTGSVGSAVVASGISLSGTLDTVSPGITLASIAPATVTGSFSVSATTSETTGNFTIGDITLVNATATGFTQASGTGYSFTVTPSVSTGTLDISVGTGTFTDTAGNPNSTSNTLSFSVNIPPLPDTTPPVVTVVSHSSGSLVSGFPTLSGSVTDSGGIASVTIGGFSATLGSGTWSKTIYDLVEGPNTVTVIATDTAGNTGSTSLVLNRISFPLNTNVELSGTTSAVITFATDLSATGIVLYGTGIGLLDLTATGSFGTSHSFALTGLLPNTIYYFVVQGQGGEQSLVMHFKTPTTIDATTASGTISATSSVYLSGSTSTGVTFANSGTIGILSLTSSGSSINISMNGLTITASWGMWDGVLQAPEVTSDAVNLSLTGYAFTGTFYQIGNANTELLFSGQVVSVTVKLGTSLSGQVVRIFRSPNQGVTYTEIIPNCTVDGSGNCTFTTNQLSRFAFAVPADVVPNVFSFSGITNAELSTLYVSNAVTMSGIGGQTAISITGGEYSINSAPFTALTGAVNPWDTVVVRVMSSASSATAVSATLTVGWVSGAFSVTTKTVTSGGGGGWGSGGSSSGWWGGSFIIVDRCPSGDTSPSYYDGRCSGTGTVNQTGTTTTPAPLPTIPSIFSGSVFNIPPIIITNLGDINFLDIGNNWAQFYIIRLVIRGIIDNVEFYHPDNNLTRAEFLKIVMNSAGQSVSNENLDIPFDDVSMSIWYAPYVSMAVSKGMISRTNANFRPDAPITRAEATKILMTAPGVPITEPSIYYFTDLDPTSDLNKYIEAARAMGILSGQIIDGELRFRPNDPITRAEIAKVVVNAFRL